MTEYEKFVRTAEECGLKCIGDDLCCKVLAWLYVLGGGYEVNFKMYESVPHEDYLHVCYGMIDICDAVYMLSDWQQSKGARMELQYAADWGKQIIYEDKSTVEPNFPAVRRTR